MDSIASLHKRVIPRRVCITFTSLLCLGITLLSAADAPVFDGKTLNGWVQRGGKAKYAVEDGVIVGTSAPPPNSFLCTEKDYGDFILELELKADAGLNSGVQVRSHCFDKETTYDFGPKTLKIPAGRVHGYQVEVDQQPTRRWSGGIYEEGRRTWLQHLEKNEAARQAYKIGEWNKYRIECVGDSIKTWVNGVPAADLIDSVTLSGFIALQVHGTDKPGSQVRFRNLKLTDLGRHEWKPLWDGTTLKGWHTIGQGDWKIEDGAIHATHAKDVKEFGHLVTDKTYTDFTVRLKYKAVKGNSGLYFRIDEKGASGVSGFQAEIDAAKDVGGLYETNGRTWVSQPTPEQVATWFKPQEWNTMSVSAHGGRIAVEVNGHRTAELLDDKGRADGKLALQVHANLDCDLFFKDIEILERVK